MSMPVTTIVSSSNTSVRQENSNNIRRDVSFSSFLNEINDETFLLALGGKSAQSLNPSITHDQRYVGRKKAEDKEIEVFDAEKYFNEGANHASKVANKDLPIHQIRKSDPFDVFSVKEQHWTATPSLRSESSCNSRSKLMHNVSRNQQPVRKMNKKSFLASIGCNCSCNDKNSVDIDDYTGENSSSKSTNIVLENGKSKQEDQNRVRWVKKSQSEHNYVKFDELGLRLNSDSHFSFPVFNPKSGNHVVKMQVQEDHKEVIGSQILENGRNSLSMEKRLNMLAWDAISPGVEETQIPSVSNELHRHSDSDASSDLFEIESLSKNGNPCLSRQGSGSMSGCITPLNCYAPSEASVQWSVITASAADLSALSDSEETKSITSTIPHPQKMGIKDKNTQIKEIPKTRSSLLSGCKSHKAVRIAGDAHRANEKTFATATRLHKSEPFTRFHVESKLAGFTAANRPPLFNTLTLSQSHSGSETHLLYTK